MITQENIPYTVDEIKAMVKPCEKYNKALERAKYALTTDMDNSGYWAVYYIFPELKENEDERIRKGLVKAFGTVGKRDWGGLIVRDILTWLEKQGEKKHITNVPSREVILSIWDLGNEWKELTNGCISTEYGTQLDYIQKHWHESEYYLKEKQGEQTQFDYEHADIPQKDFSPIEPKFKVGDWITDGDYTWKIVEIKPLFYILQSQDGNIVDDTISYVDEHFHLWTTQDAKDDDILSFETEDCEWILIYEKIIPSRSSMVPHDSLKYHVLLSGDVLSDSGICAMVSDDYDYYFHPATKEQRDLLFTKMKDAGYEWDADKKELKKIESKKLDADKVIAWMDYNICRAYNYDGDEISEDFINQFKEDFRLC